MFQTTNQKMIVEFQMNEGTTILGYFRIFSETSTSPGNQHVTQAWG